MSTIALPGPISPYRLRPTLSFVTRLEEKGGNIFKMAEQLLQGELGISEILRLLLVAYEAAGCDMTEDEAADYLLNACPVSPAHLLSDIFVAVLSPLYTVRAVEIAEENIDAGKTEAAQESG